MSDDEDDCDDCEGLSNEYRGEVVGKAEGGGGECEGESEEGRGRILAGV